MYTGTDLPASSVSTSTSDTQSITSYTVLLGNQTWSSQVSYDAGPQPYNNKGATYLSPLPAGDTTIRYSTITGVYPVFASTFSIDTLTQQSLQVMTTFIEIVMVAETPTSDKQTVDIPDAWSTITSIQLLNPLTGVWDTIDSSLFDVTAITRTINGSSVNYN